MGLYPKKLRSVADLEREKRRLRGKLEELDQEPLFSFDGLFGNGADKDEAGDAGGNILASLAGFLPALGPVAGIISGLVKNRLAKKTNDRTASKDTSDDGNVLSSILREFAGGYLKWKAMQLGLKLLKHFLGQKKNTTQR